MNGEIGKVLKKEVGAITGVETPIREYVSTGNIALDWAVSGSFLGKGLPVGRVVEFFGNPSTGKSLLIMHILANTQKKGGIAVLDDTEQAYDRCFAERIGVDVSELYMLDSVIVEEHFKKVDKVVKSIRSLDKKVLVTVALDSLALLSTRHEREVGFDKVDMFKAKLIRQGMRSLGAEFSKQNVLYVVANHVIANIGVLYGPKTTTPGGSGIPFQSSVRVELNLGSVIVREKDKKVGVHVKAEVVKNKIAPPFKKVELDVYFDKGVDKLSGLFDVLVSEGVFIEGGGWYIYKEKRYRRKELEDGIEKIVREVENG